MFRIVAAVFGREACEEFYDETFLTRLHVPLWVRWPLAAAVIYILIFLSPSLLTVGILATGLGLGWHIGFAIGLPAAFVLIATWCSLGRLPPRRSK